MGRRRLKLKIDIPETYTRATKSFMKNVISELNERDDINPLLMEGVINMLMSAYETNQLAKIQLDRERKIIAQTPKGMTAHPAVAVQLKSNQQVLALMKELGLTVKARKVLDVVDIGNDQLSLFNKQNELI